MKIACYCQHVLGIGHFHRSLEICKSLARHHETVMILGGPDVQLPETAVRFVQLPGLKMDSDFSRLLVCQEGAKLHVVQQQRRKQLWDFFNTFRPDVFLVELYPFGRKAFRFELDPILEGIGTGSLAPCLRLCSLRDILVEKSDRQKYETRVLKRLNTSFDGLLIHADPEYIPLSKTFASMEKIDIPHFYTGFISPSPTPSQTGERLRQELNLNKEDKCIVASIGGGSVGEELLLATARAAIFLEKQYGHLHFHLFCGPYAEPDLADRLRSLGGSNIKVHSFSSRFPKWLDCADLSISMAGYNTCMNLLRAAVPSLLYPFAQNREQQMRVSALSKGGNFRLLEESDLEEKTLAATILTQLQLQRKKMNVNLNGADTSLKLIESTSLWERTT